MPSRSPVRKTAKKRPPAKRVSAVKRKKTAAKKEKPIGKVVHYYDRIGVAIVELKSPLRIGDSIRMKRGDLEMLVQKITSMQLEHVDIERAKKGDVIGVKVNKVIPEGSVVLAV